MGDAADWVGKRQDGDRLAPETIAQGLPAEAAALKEMLGDSQVTTLATQRARHSQNAQSAQDRFRRLSMVAVIGGAIAALASGVLLYGAGGDGAAPPSPEIARQLVDWAAAYRTPIAVVQVLGLFAATAASALLAHLDLGGRWEASRRKAESGRIPIVNRIVELAAADPGTGAGSRLRQALEFCRRYQLELQTAFYENRGAEHARSYGRVGFVLAALAGVAAVLGTIGGLGGPFMVIAAFLGIAVPILVSAAQSWTVIGRDNEKQSAYAAAVEALEAIRMDLSAARARADAGDVEAVRQFVDRIHEVMRGEHAAWRAVGGAGD